MAPPLPQKPVIEEKTSPEPVKSPPNESTTKTETITEKPSDPPTTIALNPPSESTNATKDEKPGVKKSSSLLALEGAVHVGKAPMQHELSVQPTPAQASTRPITPKKPREGSARSRRAKTAERRARTASRARDRPDLCAQERRDHLLRGLDRFRNVVRKLQGRKDLMERLRRESDVAKTAAATKARDVAVQAVQAVGQTDELEGLCFSLEDEPEVEPDGPIPTMEEYLERLRLAPPVVE